MPYRRGGERPCWSGYFRSTSAANSEFWVGKVVCTNFLYLGLVFWFQHGRSNSLLSAYGISVWCCKVMNDYATADPTTNCRFCFMINFVFESTSLLGFTFGVVRVWTSVTHPQLNPRSATNLSQQITGLSRGCGPLPFSSWILLWFWSRQCWLLR